MHPIRVVDRSGNNQIINTYLTNQQENHINKLAKESDRKKNRSSTEAEDRAIMYRVMKEKLDKSTRKDKDCKPVVSNLSRQMETHQNKKTHQHRHKRDHRNLRILDGTEQLNGIIISNGDNISVFPIKSIRKLDRSKLSPILIDTNKEGSDLELPNFNKNTIINKSYNPLNNENLNTKKTDNDVIIESNHLGKNINFKQTQEKIVPDDYIEEEDNAPTKETSEGNVYLDDNTLFNDDPVVEGNTVVERNTVVEENRIVRNEYVDPDDRRRCVFGSVFFGVIIVGLTVSVILQSLGIVKAGKGGRYDHDPDVGGGGGGGPGGGGGGGGGI